MDKRTYKVFGARVEVDLDDLKRGLAEYLSENLAALARQAGKPACDLASDPAVAGYYEHAAYWDSIGAAPYKRGPDVPSGFDAGAMVEGLPDKELCDKLARYFITEAIWLYNGHPLDVKEAIVVDFLCALSPTFPGSPANRAARLGSLLGALTKVGGIGVALSAVLLYLSTLA